MAWGIESSVEMSQLLKLRNPREDGVIVVGEPWYFDCPHCDARVWVNLRFKPPPRVLLKRCTVLGDEWGNRILEHDYDPL